MHKLLILEYDNDQNLAKKAFSVLYISVGGRLESWGGAECMWLLVQCVKRFACSPSRGSGGMPPQENFEK